MVARKLLLPCLLALGAVAAPHNNNASTTTQTGSSSTEAAVEASTTCTANQGSSTSNPTSLLLDLTKDPQQSFADPRSLFYKGTYYAYATNSWAQGGPNVNWASSTCPNTGWSWKLLRGSTRSSDPNNPIADDLLPKAGTWTQQFVNGNPTGNAGVWDPYVAFIEDKGYFLMWYAALINGGKRCIGVAKSSSPTGLFTPVGSQPLLCDEESISPTYFVDPATSNKYLVYKSGGGEMQGMDPGQSSQIKLVQLDSDDPTTLADPTGTQATLYYSVPQDNSAGKPVNNPYDQDAEGPSITAVKQGGDYTYFLFYVVNNYQSPEYAIHYVTSTNGIGGTANKMPPSGSQAPQGTYDGATFSQDGFILGTNFTGTTGIDNNQPAITNGVSVLAPGGPSFLYPNDGGAYEAPTEMMFMTDDPYNSACDQVVAPLLRGPRMSKIEFSGNTVSFASKGNWGDNLAGNAQCASG